MVDLDVLCILKNEDLCLYMCPIFVVCGFSEHLPLGIEIVQLEAGAEPLLIDRNRYVWDAKLYCQEPQFKGSGVLERLAKTFATVENRTPQFPANPEFLNVR